MTRREFAQRSVQASAGCLALCASNASAKESGMQYGVQMFTVRKEAEADLPGTLKALAGLGLTEVELSPLNYTLPARALRQMVTDAGLRAPAGHCQPAMVMERLAYAKELGLEYMVVMLPQPKPVSLDDYRRYAEELNKLGAAVYEHGMELCFLGHSHEFLPQEGTTGFAEMMRLTDPLRLKLEVDVYWIVQAGIDPSAFLSEHHDRIRILHLKDRPAGLPPSFDATPESDHSVELGKGAIAWPSLLAQSRRQGIQHAYLDFDRTSQPVLETLRESIAYLKRIKP